MLAYAGLAAAAQFLTEDKAIAKDPLALSVLFVLFWAAWTSMLAFPMTMQINMIFSMHNARRRLQEAHATLGIDTEGVSTKMRRDASTIACVVAAPIVAAAIVFVYLWFKDPW